jgi:two-component system, OmpR family, sensor kinase
MAGQEVLSSHRAARPGPWSRLKHLSDRTPLRTKLIAAVLALVVMALAAISVTSVFVLRSYLYTQRDSQLQAAYNRVANAFSDFPGGVPAQLDSPYYGLGSGIVLAFQNPGSQIQGTPLGPPPPGMSKSSHETQSLPELPTSKNWAPSNNAILTTAPAQSGGDTWRVLAQAIQVTNTDTNAQQTSTMIIAVDLGPVGAEIQRLITVELTVGAAIVVVLAIVGVAVVRANLRPLDDIEITAGEIAKGHLDHRVPERDPRTEIGSLGRSLNAMLTQIETAFHAQQESERAAHESEERMRRFIADASHELRTPLTTIRGFAAHYRQRGGASRLSSEPSATADAGAAGGAAAAAGAASGEGQDRAFRTGSAVSAPVNGSSGAGLPSEGLSPQDLDHLMARVEAEATRMGLLVEDLLTLARLDQQRPLNKAPVDLLTLAADAVQDARVVSPGRPIELIVAPGTAFLVDGDEPRLRQVLANLVNNAITHTPTGTPIRVKIGRGTLETPGANGAGGRAGIPETDAPGEWGGAAATAATAEPSGAARQVVPAVVLDVEDDGPGMAADQAQRVFERFYRADAARNRASGGTGLGLAIVAGLVSAHGGTVSVRTAPGKGADFQVKLPLSPDALPADDADDADDLPA